MNFATCCAPSRRPFVGAERQEQLLAPGVEALPALIEDALVARGEAHGDVEEMTRHLESGATSPPDELPPHGVVGAIVERGGGIVGEHRADDPPAVRGDRALDLLAHVFTPA
ncbi:MAG: hypothetical protein JNL79_15660 [Myxococcales bacterium]|nr:hypothetical protein [Myxococcales bacterium]